MSTAGRSRATTIAGALVIVLGSGLGVSHVRHVLIMDALLGVLIQAVVPLVLSLGIVWLGASVVAGHLVDARDARRFVSWVTVGVALLLLVALWLLLHGIMMGHPPQHAFALAMNAATVGALLGIAVGTYDSQRRRSEQMLQRQNERLDQFASVVAHDIRNPLGVAMGRVDLAREERDSDDLEIATGALDRMDQLVDDVLLLARTGNDVVASDVFVLDPVTVAAWETAGAETATLEVVDDLGRIEGDRNRIRQLFENLFRNAVEHAGVDAEVRVGRTHDGFYVEDDGPGIPEDERDEVFEYGYTTASSTGFGLAIIKSIVEAHDWTVTISTTDDGGTRFTFGDVLYPSAG